MSTETTYTPDPDKNGIFYKCTPSNSRWSVRPGTGENRATFQAFELIQEMTVKCKSEKGPSAAQMKRLFEEHHDDMLWEVNRAERTQRLEDNLTSAQQNNSEVRENLSSAKTVLYDTQGTHMNVSGNSTSGDQT